ncbi:MAG: hypothetical protein Kow00107_00570 [Planctomycetota bacterium]
MKKAVGFLLIAFSVFSLGYLTGRETAPVAGSEAAPVSTQNSESPAKVLNVYYFHVTKRCNACKTIEKYTKEVLEERFSEQLKDGSIRFHSINYDLPENKHYVDDYGFSFNTVFLSKVENGVEVDFWNLSEIWNHYKDRDDYMNYVESEIRNFIENKAESEEKQQP